jgi:hypothetical protein
VKSPCPRAPAFLGSRRIRPIALAAARSLGRTLGLAAVLAFAACGRNIGDNCTTNPDCSPNGDRTCDLSQPGGYCTIEGCDQTSCPDNSACVRFFPVQFINPTPACDPACEDTDPATPMAAMSNCQDRVPACLTDTALVPNDCAPDQICLSTAACGPSGGKCGICAPRSAERRLCVKTCGSNDDCRGGYECRPGGSMGSVPLLGDVCGQVSFCAPLVK